MGASYLGALEKRDPLYGYLVDDVLPRLDRPSRDPVFHVSRMHGTNLVYRYTEEATGIAMVGKFFTAAKPHKAVKLDAEFDNLNRVRSLGLAAPPNYVVQPIGRDKRFGLGLLEEYVSGKDLDHYLRRAAYEGRSERLMKRLGDLAGFLAELHKRTGTAYGLDMEPSAAYFDKVAGELREKGVLEPDEELKLKRLRDAWLALGFMALDREVLLHGDATPTNFIFAPHTGVVAIDLERMRPGDRMYDVGMICGELKHAFMWRLGDRFASEPFIGRFLREYASRFDPSGGFFWAITTRVPFYMAMTELRIARNSWLDTAHRKNLVREAIRCLRHGLEHV